MHLFRSRFSQLSIFGTYTILILNNALHEELHVVCLLYLFCSDVFEC